MEREKNTTTPVRSKLKKRITEYKKKLMILKIIELGVNPAVSLITNNEQMDFL